ncbi:MAG: acyltransferase family protein, partial [Firmicutes bacterium]|nr:acyltransferase family protein [Bacillota bacterium]
MKKRLAEPDLLRCLAAFAVIGQHILGAYGRRDISIADMRWIVVLFELARFAVPAFVFLAGLMAVLPSSESTRPGAYLLRRLRTVALPYLAWTLLYLYDGGMLTGLSSVVSALWKGSAAYHLWYVPLILQFTLLTPLFRVLRRPQEARHRAADCCKVLAVAAAFALLCVLDRIRVAFPGSFIARYNYNLFPAWLFYFVLGALFGSDYERLLALVKRFWYAPAAIAALQTARIIRADLSYINTYQKVSFSIVSTVQPGFALGAAATILTLLAAASCLQRIKPVAAATRFVSIHSYRMYLIHVMAINHINRQLVARRDTIGQSKVEVLKKHAA